MVVPSSFNQEDLMVQWVMMTTFSSQNKANPKDNNSGMTLIEIMIVMAIIAVTLVVVAPQLSVQTGTDAATKLSRLQADIKAAYDLALLNRQTFRFVFEFESGDYHLEIADRSNVILSDEKLNCDPSQEQEKDALGAFEQQFKEFKEIAGEGVHHPDGDKKIPETSPVLKAEDKLAPPKWEPISDMELGGTRSLGPNLFIYEMQAEHHANKQMVAELPEKARGFLYVFPDGRVENGYLKIAYKKGEKEIDETQVPYVLKIDSFTGTTTLISGNDEVQLDEKH